MLFMICKSCKLIPHDNSTNSWILKQQMGAAKKQQKLLGVLGAFPAVTGLVTGKHPDFFVFFLGLMANANGCSHSRQVQVQSVCVCWGCVCMCVWYLVHTETVSVEQLF